MTAVKNIVVSFREVAKKYCPDRSQSNRYAIRDLLNPLALAVNQRGLRAGEVWSLKQISFEIAENESFGIFGGAQSGKSTIAKLASGMLRPDRGTIRTPVRKLLLNHTNKGLRPMLTLLENAHFLAVLYGANRRQAKKVAKDALEFAGCGDRSSDILYNMDPLLIRRMVFSIYLFTETDFLIIDDVFSAGDEEFKLRAIPELESRIRRTTCLVLSENVEILERVCTRFAYLEAGELRPLNTVESLRSAGSMTVSGTPHASSLSGDDGEDDEGDDTYLELSGPRSLRKLPGAVTEASLNGREMRYWLFTPLVTAGNPADLRLCLIPSVALPCSRIQLRINLAGQRFPLATRYLEPPNGSKELAAGLPIRFRIHFIIPPLVPGYYGISLFLEGGTGAPGILFKVAAFGIPGRPKGLPGTLDIGLVELEMKSRSSPPEEGAPERAGNLGQLI